MAICGVHFVWPLSFMSSGRISLMFRDTMGERRRRRQSQKNKYKGNLKDSTRRGIEEIVISFDRVAFLT